MAGFVYNEGAEEIALGNIDFVNDDIRAIVVMTNTTADTENQGIDFIGDFTTLDEYDQSYTRPVLSGKSISKVESAATYVKHLADNLNLASLAAGTRSIAGVVVYKHITNDAASIPLAWCPLSTPKAATGADFPMNWSADYGAYSLRVAS